MNKTIAEVLNAEIEKGEDQFFIIQCKEYPQFITQGKTIEEAVKMLKSLISFELKWSNPQIMVSISEKEVSKL